MRYLGQAPRKSSLNVSTASSLRLAIHDNSTSALHNSPSALQLDQLLAVVLLDD